MSPPRFAAAEGQASGDGGTNNVNTEQEAKVSQQTVKKTLLRALGLWRSLGLEDSEIEIACLRIKHLLDKFEECHANIDFAASCNLWKRLKASACGEQPDSQLQLDPAVAGDKMKRQRQPRALQSDKHMYNPGPHRSKLRTIEHRPLEPKVLQCERCSHEMISCWYFVHPKTSRATVLVPNNGHMSCKGEPGAGSRAFFKPVDGSRYKADCTSGIVYCVHNRVQAVCAPCGGANVCQHHLPKWQCSECKLKIRKRIKKVIAE